MSLTFAGPLPNVGTWHEFLMLLEKLSEIPDVTIYLKNALSKKERD